MGCICSLAAWIVKYILFLANVLFVLSGIAIIVVGSLAQANFSDFQGLLQGAFSATAITIIVIGCLIFVIAFCGCCGAISESRCLLLTYGCLLLGILLVQVGVGIWALSNPDASENLTKIQVESFWQREYQDGESKTFDSIQRKLECCGVDSAADYLTLRILPLSCCPETVLAKDCIITNPLNYYHTGCYTKLTNYIDSAIQSIGIVAIAVAGFEVLAAVFAFCLASHIKE